MTRARTAYSAPRDANREPVIMGVSSADGVAPTPVEVDPTSGGTLVSLVGAGGLVPQNYDYVAYTNTSTTVDTYVFKTGGSGGTTVATVTITYVATDKAQVSTVART